MEHQKPVLGKLTGISSKKAQKVVHIAQEHTGPKTCVIVACLSLVFVFLGQCQLTAFVCTLLKISPRHDSLFEADEVSYVRVL